MSTANPSVASAAPTRRLRFVEVFMPGAGTDDIVESIRERARDAGGQR